MREIKFRGWHTVAKKMFSAEEMADDQLTLLTTGSFINVNGDCIKLSTIYDREKFIPLQYTGLKDKNGKEIYEGDILRTATDKPMVVGWSDRFASFVIHRDGWAFQHWFGEACNPEDCEVIGNIYQNPELLNQ